MKASLLFFLLLWTTGLCFGQHRTKADTLAGYLQEIETASLRHQKLWNKNLYGPILLVDPASRTLWANRADSAGLLKQEGALWVGQLPASVNIANTALHWNGRRWAMLLLPLPANQADRLQLLAHELFHLAQPDLGFALHMPANDHLDSRQGRVWLRLELEALKEALQATTATARQEHLGNALLFRRYRHSLFPEAEQQENELELNEGLAEYTGLMMSGRQEEGMKRHLLQKQQLFQASPSYVRSFAYQTLPAWGYLLAQRKADWNLQLTPQTALTPYLQKAFAIKLPVQLQQAAARESKRYGGEQIRAEEEAREVRLQQELAEYTRRFVEQPRLLLPFRNMSISFDPGNLVPLPGRGTVYPNLRVTDEWGILTVKEGALISADWSSVTVCQPGQLSAGKASGRGWVLELNEGYRIELDSLTQQYMLKK